MELGEIKAVGLKDIWNHEALAFTPWLADNLDRLGQALGLELELDTREAPVGEFSLDILARDLGRNRLVVIENQLNRTDHDHLGKLITYASGFDAAVVIWVSPELREEHRQALDWLNSRTDEETEFFGVVVDALTIDGSRPAVQFRPVAAPNTWSKGKAHASRKASPRGEAYREFFQNLIDTLREEHRFTGAKVAQPANWYEFSSGISRIHYYAGFAADGRCRAEVYIQRGDAATNKAIFDRLAAERERIEAEFGEPLAWERQDDLRGSRIAACRPGSIEDSPEQLCATRAWFVERLLKLKEVFGARLQSLA